jgi:tetratricopeptide (TPR) repeat protein/4-amino-4-deoxy-L-arabinose transferase-like glycosyltransferase
MKKQPTKRIQEKNTPTTSIPKNETNTDTSKTVFSVRQYLKTNFLEYYAAKPKNAWHKFITEPLATIKEEGLQGLNTTNHAFYRLTFAVLMVLMGVTLCICSMDVGINWDEPIHVGYAEDVHKFYSSFGKDTTVFDSKAGHVRFAMLYYGTSFDYAAYLFDTFLSPFDGIYESRHFLNALTGLTAILFTALIAQLYGGWRTANIAALLMFLTPFFFGHSLFNHKDVPFTMGVAMTIYYALLFVKQMPAPNIRVVVWLIISASITISVKIAGMIVFGYIGIFAAGVWLMEVKTKGWAEGFKLVPKYAFWLLIIFFFSYILGIFTWPYGIRAPFSNPFIALKEFSNFRFLITYELFEGNRINMENPPWYYIPKWILITAPLTLLFGALVGLLPIPAKLKQYPWEILLAMIFTFVFPIASVVYQNSTLYSSWRHLMFVFPPLVVVAAGGWDYLIGLPKQKILQGAVAICFLASFAPPIYWSIKNHPQEYIYFNELVGGIDGAYGKYETDYWCNSMRLASEWLVQNEPVKDKKTVVVANFEVTSAQYYINKYTDSVQVIWTRENEKYYKDWDYAFFGTRGMSAEKIKNTFPPKGTIHIIKADNTPLLAIVKREDKSLYEAHLARMKGDNESALFYAKKAVAYEPQNPEAQRMLAMVYMSLGENDSVVSAVKQCVTYDPDDFTAYTILGMAYNNQKDYKRAILAYNKAVALKINNSSAYQGLGRAYTELADFQNAMKYYELAVNYDNGQNPQIFFDAAYALVQQGLAFPQLKENRFRAAIQNWNTVIQMQPNNWSAYQNIAYAYQEIGQPEEAQKVMAVMQARMQGGQQ